jgi:hypothetical protein
MDIFRSPGTDLPARRSQIRRRNYETVRAWTSLAPCALFGEATRKAGMNWYTKTLNSESEFHFRKRFS